MTGARQPVSPYVASHIKRHRATGGEVDRRRIDLLEITREVKPATVRQVFYQATVRGIVEKTEAGYTIVQRELVYLRMHGLMPWDWLADNTRWMRKPRTWRDPAEALEATAALYRKALWADAEVQVEIWLEKDALSGVIYNICSHFDVPLMVTRGYASLSFLFAAAEKIVDLDRPAYIYHLGDFDPSGVDAGRKIEETLRHLAPEAEISFRRLAVTPEQIDLWELPSRPTKQSDTRAKKFGSAISVELDAISPDMLRLLVERAIERHLPRDQYAMLKAAEESERDGMKQWAAALRGGGEGQS